MMGRSLSSDHPSKPSGTGRGGGVIPAGRRGWHHGETTLSTSHGSGRGVEAAGPALRRRILLYTARWGHADEFIRLFKKNHLPVLKRQIESGRILRVTAVKPRYHATEDGRWDYRVTIVFRDAEAASDASGEEAIKAELFPDQETFRREEQRRFEILQAHWDVPIEEVDLDR